MPPTTLNSEEPTIGPEACTLQTTEFGITQTRLDCLLSSSQNSNPTPSEAMHRLDGVK